MGELQPTICTKRGFEGLASPFGVATRCPSHCCPRVAHGDSDHTDLPLTTPSSHLSRAVPHECYASGEAYSNIRRGSRSLPDLTGHLTARADDGHAIPLSASGKPFRLTIIVLSPLVSFPALNPIKPQTAPLVCSPANSFKFQPCDRTSQVARLMASLRHCMFAKNTQYLAGIVYS